MQSVGLRERVSYGFGDLASNLSNATISTFLVYYYTNFTAIPAAAAGSILLAVLLIVSFWDVATGILVDRTHTRFGRARPWLLCLCLPFAVTFTAVFSVPALPVTGRLIYAFFSLLLYNFAYSSINVPYGILNTLITRDQYERSLLNLVRMFMAYGTTIVINLITMRLVGFFGVTAAAWQKTALLYACLAVFFFLATFFFTKERVVSVSRPNVPIPSGIRGLFRNRYWKLLMLFAVVQYVYVSVNSGVTVYYAQHILGHSEYVGVINLAFYIPIAAGMFLLAPMIRRFGKRNLSVAGILIACAGTLLMSALPATLPNVLLCSVIKGIGIMPAFGTFYSMVADTIEYGEWATGIRSEGLIYSASSFGVKMGMGLGSGLIGWILAAGRYANGAAAQPASAVSAIRFLYLLLPVLLFALMLVILALYRLDREYPDIIVKLDARRAAAARDPQSNL
jgi:GPH family glycoside/pentoside/hexuronide:cation symporter